MRTLSTILLAFLFVLATTLSGSAQDKGKDIVKEGSQVVEVAGKTLDQWVDDLSDRDPSVQEAAIRSISNFGDTARHVAPRLFTFLDVNKDISLRVNAVITLGAIGIEDRDIGQGVGALQRLLMGDSQGIVRYQVAMTLGRIGPRARSALTTLMQQTIVDRTSWEIRKAAAYAVGSVGAGDKMTPADSRAVAALIKALNDPCSQVRMEAIMGLSNLGPSLDPAAIPQIVKTLTYRLPYERHPIVGIYNRLLLMQYDVTFIKEGNLVPIAQQLKNPDLQVRLQAARALHMLGPKAKSRIPDLIEALKDKETIVATAATSALVAMKDDITDSHLEDIAKILRESEQHYVRCHAAQALGALGQRAKFKVNDLIWALRDKNKQVVITSAMSLIDLGDASKRALPYLKELRNHSEIEVQDAAEIAIYAIENPDAARPMPEKK